MNSTGVSRDSTVPEVIVARQHGLRVLAISCLTNLGAGLSPHALDHAEVKEMAERTAGSLGALIIDVLGHV